MNFAYVCRLAAIYTWVPVFKYVRFDFFVIFQARLTILFTFHIKSVMFIFEKQIKFVLCMLLKRVVEKC